jgi:hypothetical protein
MNSIFGRCEACLRLRRYLIGNPKPKDHKEDPSTDGRITSNNNNNNNVCELKESIARFFLSVE